MNKPFMLHKGYFQQHFLPESFKVSIFVIKCFYNIIYVITEIFSHSNRRSVLQIIDTALKYDICFTCEHYNIFLFIFQYLTKIILEIMQKMCNNEYNLINLKSNLTKNMILKGVCFFGVIFTEKQIK